MNQAFCNTCQKLVPAKPVERDGRIFLAKECPDCGTNETYISSDAARYNSKRALDIQFDHKDCLTNCQTCKHTQAIRFTFVNVTNRCNANCPICFDNVPGLGFAFEPPIEYFDNLFKGLAQLKPVPTVCLFGGEPTVRKDIFDIIKLSKSYGLRTRLFTNGIRMADEEYCRKVVASHVHILLSYDGSDPETYRQLRGDTKMMDLKRKAIDNIGKMSDVRRGKITVVWVVSKGLNDQCMPELLEFCHSRRDIIGDVYLMPLCHAWDESHWHYNPDRITTEDVEEMVEKAFPGYDLKFLPLGFVHQLASLTEIIGREAIPYGAHPNCESVYYLVSDGEKYVPIGHYLKGTALELADDFLKLEQRLTDREKRWHKGLFGRTLGALHIRGLAQKMLGMGAIALFVRRRVRIFRLLKGRGLGKLGHLVLLPIQMLLARKSRAALRRHTWMQSHLKLVVLPLEDNHVLETDRLERCPTAQAYYDPKTQKTRFIPLCAWKLHNKKILRELAEYYGSKHEPAGAARE